MCGKKKQLLYKKRHQRFCSLRCAYIGRTPREKRNRPCVRCGEPLKTGRKYCSKACASVVYSETYRHGPEVRQKMSESRRGVRRTPAIIKVCLQCGKEFVTHGRRNGKKKYCSEKCRLDMMLTDNVMKRPSVARKVSKWRRNMPESIRKKYSEGMKKAWFDGKYDNARVGQCEWFAYRCPDGSVYKVQGTWELAFIDWMVCNQLIFTCHRGRVYYVLDGEKHWWMPDFWVQEWDAYVDVKCNHFYNEEKFDSIRQCNPELNVVVLFLEDLKNMGVKIYEKGNQHHRHLASLIQRSRL